MCCVVLGWGGVGRAGGGIKVGVGVRDRNRGSNKGRGQDRIYLSFTFKNSLFIPTFFFLLKFPISYLISPFLSCVGI